MLEIKSYPGSLTGNACSAANKNASFSLQVAGTYQGLRSGFALYGTEGTLHLDLDSKKLTLAIKEEGVHTFYRDYSQLFS